MQLSQYAIHKLRTMDFECDQRNHSIQFEKMTIHTFEFSYLNMKNWSLPNSLPAGQLALRSFHDRRNIFFNSTQKFPAYYPVAYSRVHHCQERNYEVDEKILFTWVVINGNQWNADFFWKWADVDMD